MLGFFFRYSLILQLSCLHTGEFNEQNFLILIISNVWIFSFSSDIFCGLFTKSSPSKKSKMIRISFCLNLENALPYILFQVYNLPGINFCILYKFGVIIHYLLCRYKIGPAPLIKTPFLPLYFSVTCFPSLLRYNQQIKLHIFRLYNVMIWYAYVLWNDDHK